MAAETARGSELAVVSAVEEGMMASSRRGCAFSVFAPEVMKATAALILLHVSLSIVIVEKLSKRCREVVEKS